ncbi:hypothetical protein [Peribacillus kribbensis]|uniref:hypothetical protein n=1 Tax=Peribacillus kribbensis TaxID=356658 RepID=UPI0003F8D4E0|nr:hypothetical protein [Peribacillus kribbensis]
MTIFLLFISFVLNIAAILGIVILYTRQNKILSMEKKQKNSVREIEDILTSFAQEMKEENEVLLSKLKSPSGNGHVQKAKRELRSVPQAADKPLQKGNQRKKSKAITAYQPAVNEAGQEGGIPLPDLIQKDIVELSKQAPGGLPHSEPKPKAFEAELNSRIEEYKDSGDVYVEALLKEARALKQAGLTYGQIAQKLNKGKTEIELLLKFRG